MIQILVGTIACFLALAPASFADQVFHSERLPLFLTQAGADAGHPQLRSGHVVDIHPNGPVNGAHERYMINGAKPDHNYQVVLRIFTDDCEGLPFPDFDPFPTALLTTNKNGQAHDKFSFPAGAALPEPLSLGVFWTLVDEDGVIAYETDCILVGVDAL